MAKPPKAILKEEVDKRVKLGASWKWEKEELGSGQFRATCTFFREKNSSGIKGSGEGQGIKAAEHEAAKEILDVLEIDYSSPVSSPVRNHSSPSSGNSSGSLPLIRRTEALDEGFILDAATTNSQNFVGMLQELCGKHGIVIPRYEETRWTEPDNSTRYKTTCYVNGIAESGVARHVKDSKKIAALKCCAKMGWTSLPQKPKGNISNPSSGNTSAPRKEEKLAATLSEVSIGKATTSRSVEIPFLHKLTSSVLSSTTTDGPTMVSNKVWYYPTKSLGRGGFAEVFEGFLENPSRRMAIKKSRKEDIEDPKNQELRILREVNHQNLVKYYITEEVQGFVYIVMDIADSTLDTWVKDSAAKDYELRVKVCEDVTLGLKKLHKEKIIHRDIKPNNVLIFLETTSFGIIPKAKLTDFGLSRMMDKRPDGVTTQVGMKGTVTYVPPEAYTHPIDQVFKLKPSLDIFSLGILLSFTMTRGRHIFEWSENTHPLFIQANIAQLKVNWELLNKPELTSLRNLLQVMLSGDPEKRSEVRILLEHPFFWDYKKVFTFIKAVSNDIKNNTTENTAIQEAYNDYKRTFSNVGDDWKLRLDPEVQEWIAEKDKLLDESGRKGNPRQVGWKKYKGGSVIQLINFIRDQEQHYENWKSHPVLEDSRLFGPKGSNYGSYFAKKFPELAPIVYNILQDPKIQGDQAKAYYLRNQRITFHLRWNGL